MSIYDGGPAFPRPATIRHEQECHPKQDGMSLRDYFAAVSLPVFMNLGMDDTTIKQDAENAYLMADAMLEARKK